jgi:hypothetical protein
MTEQLDVVLFAALERWWQANRVPLAARGVTGTLQGPLEAAGMDPVYILHLDSEHLEAEAHLFRGGTLLLHGLDKHAGGGIESGSVEVGDADGLTTALAQLAARA